MVAPTKQYGALSSPDETQGGNNNNVSNVISDYVISFSPYNNYKNSVTYIPTAEYRMLQLTSNNPLSNLDLRFGWKDRYNNVYDILLKVGGYASIKIMFRMI
jgi:hypothetical protein